MTTPFVDNYRFLARYNCWINQRLYEACEALSDEGRKRDRGSFFGSIHRTLSHLVLADQVWLKRFAQCGTENGITFPSLGADVLDMPESYPQLTMRYSNSKGVQRAHPAWQALTHFFNHQTHHRGQATTLLTQAGGEVGLTDLIALV